MVAASVLKGAGGEGIWVGSNSFGADPLHTGSYQLPGTTNKGHRENIRAEPAVGPRGGHDGSRRMRSHARRRRPL